MSSVSQEFISRLQSIGYKELTPIQKLAIPSILKGKHTLVIAPTGYGKTEAAIIPVIYQIFARGYERISALYVTPLRALNRDLEGRLRNFGQAFGIRVATRHGDNSRKERREIILNPPDLLITTPETLLYLVVDKRLKKLLANLRWIIIDELQEMLDQKRGYELSVVLQRLRRISRNPRFIGLSATISDVELAKSYLSLDEEVEVARVDGRKDTEILIETPEPSHETVELAVKKGMDPVLLARLLRLREIIEKNRPVLIFTNTRETAEFLANQLQTMFNLRVATHHGSLSREIRMNMESSFKAGELDAIVATSSLELGIDIGSISLVVQYMSPRQTIRLLQRVGRSGHSLHRKARGVVIPGNYAYDVLECKAITELSKSYLEPMIVEENPLDVLAHQIAGMVIEGPLLMSDALEIFRGSPYFRTLSPELLEAVVEQLEAERVVRREGQVLKPSRRTWKYYYTVNMIPDSNMTYLVINTDTNSRIGNLDFDFVSILDEDSIFVLGGRLWKVVSIEEGKVYVSPAELKKGDLPSWFGEAIPVEKEVSMKVYEYLTESFAGRREAEPELKEKVEEHLSRNYPILKRDSILVELVNSDLLVVHSPFGTRGNNTLGSLISAVLSSIGYRTSFRSDAYHVALTSMVPLEVGIVEDVLNKVKSMSAEYASRLLEQQVVNEPEFKWILLIEAQRFGAIEKGAEIKLGHYVLRAYVDTVIGKESIKEFMLRFHDLSILSLLKEMKWDLVEVPSPSPLAQEFLDRLLVFTSVDDKPIMVEVFKRRLMNKEILSICLLCGWNSKVKVAETPERCPRCGSVFITSTFPDDREALEIVRRNIRGEKLNRKEQKRLSELKSIASLYSNYGRIAFLALAVRGIGPTNLGRVLRSLSQGEDKFYQTLMEEERKFIRYRKYWQ
ncbi:DEAD/DEAH box helicase [Metallosphaera javensis (ex Sakai et al. 2022)]|uniref:DEAD/DEAH box helicase n=1 Tax=Metallosphaera javensis (ex Sakai et al. 2022) TaxID=2775498 RepID=UPI00258E5427|nr:MAG: ATP-dependent DNA helicase Hel308 [Metallosphaera javensis (ex Sakai et al. 2022)]